MERGKITAIIHLNNSLIFIDLGIIRKFNLSFSVHSKFNERLENNQDLHFWLQDLFLSATAPNVLNICKANLTTIKRNILIFRIYQIHGPYPTTITYCFPYCFCPFFSSGSSTGATFNVDQTLHSSWAYVFCSSICYFC